MLKSHMINIKKGDIEKEYNSSSLEQNLRIVLGKVIKPLLKETVLLAMCTRPLNSVRFSPSYAPYMMDTLFIRGT